MSRSARALGNLPAETTSFVGRRRELTALRTKLSTGRLVTLVGPGGVGKSRLAIQAARELGRRFHDGAWLVELADVRSDALVSNAVLEGLDLRDQAAEEPLALLLAYLRDRELMLVIDNCEHVLAGVRPLVTEVLKSAPGVRVIATSRETLVVAGEQILDVRSLEVPRPTEELNRLQLNEAVALFVDRAGAASGAFDLTAGNWEAVVELCRRLDGLPLAIELAAVRTRVLSVEEIVDRLADRFGLLHGNRSAPERQRTLLATFEWSHDLLPVAERALLRRLSMFAGPFTIEDVESVCTSGEVLPADVLELVSSLVAKSLVMREDNPGRASYRLHETLREYSALKLREAGEVAAIEERCAVYYRSRCQQSAVEARSRLLDWLSWMDLEIDNVRAVLERALASGNIALGTEVATFMWWYWMTRATTEGVRWIDTFIEASRGVPAASGWPLFVRGFLAVLQADPATARPMLRSAVEAARASGDVQLLSQSLSMASVAEVWAGDAEAANRLLAEAKAVTEPLGDPVMELGVLQAQALNGFRAGDLHGARSAAVNGVELSRKIGDLYAFDMRLLNLSRGAIMGQDLEQAKPLLAEGLVVAHGIDDRIAQFLWLNAYAYHAACSGDMGSAARLLGAAHTRGAEAGASVNPLVAPMLAHAEASATAALGSAKFAMEFNSGKQLKRDEARRLALGERQWALRASKNNDGLLGRREGDVARLVAEGLSNKEIGSRLFISERTAESHVHNILNKLGLKTRGQIATWVAMSAREQEAS